MGENKILKAVIAAGFFIASCRVCGYLSEGIMSNTSNRPVAVSQSSVFPDTGVQDFGQNRIQERVNPSSAVGSVDSLAEIANGALSVANSYVRDNTPYKDWGFKNGEQWGTWNGRTPFVSDSKRGVNSAGLQLLLAREVLGPITFDKVFKPRPDREDNSKEARCSYGWDQSMNISDEYKGSLWMPIEGYVEGQGYGQDKWSSLEERMSFGNLYLWTINAFDEKCGGRKYFHVGVSIPDANGRAHGFESTKNTGVHEVNFAQLDSRYKDRSMVLVEIPLENSVIKEELKVASAQEMAERPSDTARTPAQPSLQDLRATPDTGAGIEFIIRGPTIAPINSPPPGQTIVPIQLTPTPYTEK